MDEHYAQNVAVFKALADTNRLMIVDMLSCGELCACDILKKLNITQPTLSHHMKSLCACALIKGRKEGKWTYYSLNNEVAQGFRAFLNQLISDKEDCICREEGCHCE